MYRRVGALVVVSFLALSAFTPLGLSFVYSDSMEPTIQNGDGFVVVPNDDADPDDVVTFWSEHRSEYVTHRVVAETDEGYVTQGDNNPVSDQEAGHPPVRANDVVGTVLTVGATPLTIPGVGDAVTLVSRYAGVLVAVAAVAFIATAGSLTSPSRPTVRAGTLFRALVVTSVALSVVWILLAGSVVSVPVSQTERGATPETVVFDGGTETVSFTASRTSYTYREVEATGVRVVDHEPTDDGVDVTLALEDPGTDTATVRFYEYPAVLPRSIVRLLHGVDPVFAALLTAGVGHLPAVAVYLIAFDGREPIRRSRWRRPFGGS